MHILRRGIADGADLRVHADFDWGGIRIANVLHTRLPVRPWQYDAAAYHIACRPGYGHTLVGDAVTASWDPELTAAMQRVGHCVEEELVVDRLVDDLGSAAG